MRSSVDSQSHQYADDIQLYILTLQDPSDTLYVSQYLEAVQICMTLRLNPDWTE